MAPEFLSGIGVFAILDRISTNFGMDHSVEYGRYTIHPRGGKLLHIRTPQNTVMLVAEKDIIHMRGEKGTGRVRVRFTASNLPEGFSIVGLYKGDY